MKATVLLVEDHRDLAETITMSLEAADFIVDYAADGMQALQLATSHLFDAIILDVMLPIIDGFEVCKKLRTEHGLDTPILMLTARDQIEDKLEGFIQGADDYVVKPFSMAELQARVMAMINRKRGDMANSMIMLGNLSFDTRTQKETVN